MFHNNNRKMHVTQCIFADNFTRYYIKSRISRADKELRPLLLNQTLKKPILSSLDKNNKNSPRLQSLVKTYKSRDVVAIASRVATRSMLPIARASLPRGSHAEGTAVVFNEHSSIRVKSCRRFSSGNFPDIFPFVADFDAPGVNKARTNQPRAH